MWQVHCGIVVSCLNYRHGYQRGSLSAWWFRSSSPWFRAQDYWLWVGRYCGKAAGGLWHCCVFLWFGSLCALLCCWSMNKIQASGHSRFVPFSFQQISICYTLCDGLYWHLELICFMEIWGSTFQHSSIYFTFVVAFLWHLEVTCFMKLWGSDHLLWHESTNKFDFLSGMAKLTSTFWLSWYCFNICKRVWALVRVWCRWS